LPVLVASLVLASAALTAPAEAQSPSQVPAAAQLVHLPMLHLSTGFRRVNAVGQTKSPDAALDERGGSASALDAKRRQLDWMINGAICTGC
jgi:hypothetical protein